MDDIEKSIVTKRMDIAAITKSTVTASRLDKYDHKLCDSTVIYRIESFDDQVARNRSCFYKRRRRGLTG